MKRKLLLWLLWLPMITFGHKKDSLKTERTKILNTVYSDADDRAKKFLPQYAPLSPNAWSFQKFGDYQVNLATGIPSISIPIFTIQNGNLSMPITLNYHAGGFKMSEQASWVGWGFALDTGASLNRTVQGAKDDDGGYLNHPITVSRDFCYNSDDFFYGQNVLSNYVDAQPDIFSYSFPSKSGKFILGQNGDSPFKIPNYPIQIAYVKNLDPVFLSTFHLINDDGITYTFGDTESQNVTDASGPKGYISSWLLTKVRSANSDDFIDYSYQAGGTQYLGERQWSSSVILNAVPQSGGYYTNSNVFEAKDTYVSTAISQRNPHKITYANGEIEFIQSNQGERLDLIDSRYLKQMNIYNYENGIKTLIKVIKFTYSYFLNGSTNARLKLDKITITDELSTKTEEYSFNYWTNTISWNQTTDNEKKDFFGYYNGKNNAHLIPVASYNNLSIIGGAADRSTVDTYMKEGVLKRITYPTKGYTEFDYETNKYNNGVGHVFGGGLRVKSIKSFSGGNTTLKRYQYSSSEGEGVGRLTTLWSLATATAPTIQALFYRDAAGTYNSSATQASFTQSGGAVDLNTMDAAPIYYTTVTEFFEDEADQLKNGRNVYTYDFRQDVIVNAPNYTNRDVKPWRRGNLLTKTSYDKDNNTVATLTNSYQELLTATRTAAGFVNTPFVHQGTIPRSTIPCPTTFLKSATGVPGDFPEMVYKSVSYDTGINLVGTVTNQVDNVATTQTTTYTNELYTAQIQTNDSQTGNSRTELFKYPSDAAYSSDPVVQEMLSRNQRNQALENEVKETISSTTSTIYKEKKVFDIFAGANPRGYTSNILLKELWSAPKGGTLEKRATFTNYASNGNLLSYVVDDMPISLVWGYNDALLLAEIKNATKSQTDAALSTAGITASSMSVTDLAGGQLSQLQNLRNALPNAQVSWYSYRPQIGLSNMVTPNGLVNRFTYDKLNRLRSIKDHSGYLTDLYNYVYATTAPTACTTPGAPSIAVTSTNLCQVQLTASGCAGTVNWSNGAVGTSIQVDTKNSVAYTATCTVSGCTSSSSNAITAPALPTGWTAQQIGTPPVDGCVRENSGTWTLRGSGNTFNATDNFNYAYKTHSGNAVIVAKIATMSGNAPGTRTGVMLRSSTSPTADYLQLFYDNGTQYMSFYEQNSSGGDNPIAWQATTMATWLRIKKNGTTITAWYSNAASPAWNNDADWTLHSTVTSSLYNGTYLLGIMAYNNAYGSNGLTNESQLTNVATYSLSGCTPPGAPSIAVTSTNLCQVQLTASGCAGTVNWSNGAVGTSIQVDTKNSVAYTATCTVSGCTSSSSNAITAPALPSGWTALQIGTPPTAGCVRENSGTWTLRGSGNTFNATDNFNYAYKTHTGSAVIVAKIATMSGNAPGTRTGVMLRSSTSPTADYLQLFYDNGTQYMSFYEQNSVVGGDNPIAWQATTMATWIRIKKNGTTITAWYSNAASPAWNNDADWTLHSTVTSSLYNGTYLLGIMAYNNAYGSNSQINESQLTNVATYSLSGCTPPGAPSIAVTSTNLCQVQLTASGCAGTVNWSNGAVGTSIQVDTKNSVAYTATCTVSGCTSSSSNAITAPALPTGWTAQQIGTPPVDGCVRENSGTWTLRGSGNTFNATDNFNYAYKTHSGNAVIVAKIATMSGNAPGTRTGVMLRSSTSPTADYLQLFYDNGTQYMSFYEQNSSGGDNPIAWQATTMATWIRIKKNGTTITAWYSNATSPAWNNDSDWTLHSTVTSSLYNGTYLLGIMAYNNAYGSNSQINESQLTNVSTNTF